MKGKKMTAKYDKFKIYQGSTWTKKVQWKDSAGVVVDVEGFTARFTVRKRNYDGDLVLNLTTENGGITKDLVNNKFVLKASASQTSLIPNDSYLYILEVKDGVNNEYRLIYGSIKLIPEVING
jgi:hypothetical protein